MNELDESLINRAAPPGSMRYFASLYTPAAQRTSVLALYVIEAEVRQSSQSVNHDLAHARLQWWRTEIDRLVNGNPQHPATRILQRHSQLERDELSRLHELLTAADMDLARLTYSNWRELRAYCVRSGGITQQLIAAALTAPRTLREVERAAAVRLGIGVRQAEILRDLRLDALQGRVYLPLDTLDTCGVPAQTLHAQPVDARIKPALQALRETAQRELQPPVPQVDSTALRPVLVLAALHRRLLDRIAERNDDIASERIELGPVEKPWLAWRAARAARPR